MQKIKFVQISLKATDEQMILLSLKIEDRDGDLTRILMLWLSATRLINNMGSKNQSLFNVFNDIIPMRNYSYKV